MKTLLEVLSEIHYLLEEQQKKLLKKSELQRKISQEPNRLERELQDTKIEFDRKIERCKDEALVNISLINENTKLARQIAADKNDLFQQKWQQQQQKIAELRSEIDTNRLLTLPWDDPRWTPSENSNSYKPQSGGLGPGILRIGEFLLEQVGPSVRVPALVPIRDFSASFPSFQPGHIAIFSSDAESRQTALSAIESMALRVVIAILLELCQKYS